MAGKQQQKKGKFDDLEQEWKDAVSQASPEEIMKRLAEVNALEHQTLKAKSEDQHLKEVQATAREAGEGYRLALKGTKLRRAYINQVLQDKGKVA